MHMDLDGSEEIDASAAALWQALNDPDVLTKCVPGCRKMTETGPDAYEMELELKVAAVSGSFTGAICLSDKVPPSYCKVTVSGEGSLGTGRGTAEFRIVETGPGTSRLDYSGEGEIGGLVAGVGQRILKSVAKHLTKSFFKDLRKHFADAGQEA